MHFSPQYFISREDAVPFFGYHIFHTNENLQYGRQKMHHGCVWKKETVWFRPPIDWVYLTRVLCIDCKQNNLQKD